MTMRTYELEGNRAVFAAGYWINVS